MYNPQEVSERKLKKEKEKLENQKQELEQLVEIKTYLGWRDLPFFEKAKIIKEWDDYYAKILETESFKDFLIQGKAFKEGKMGIVKEIALKARKRIENNDFLARPPIVDPWEFSHGIYYRYQRICQDIQNIIKILTGVQNEGFI